MVSALFFEENLLENFWVNSRCFCGVILMRLVPVSSLVWQRKIRFHYS